MGGYHPVHLSDLYKDRYLIFRKLGSEEFAGYSIYSSDMYKGVSVWNKKPFAIAIPNHYNVMMRGDQFRKDYGYPCNQFLLFSSDSSAPSCDIQPDRVIVYKWRGPASALTLDELVDSINGQMNAMKKILK